MSWGYVAAATIAAVSANETNKSNKKSAAAQRAALEKQNALARGELSSYKEFGGEQLGDLQNWLASPEGAFSNPTPEDIRNSPGYDTRLGAVENSAAARGSLFSGNALRNVGEFGASEFDREKGRRQNELSNRLGLVNLGYGAAGGSAGLAQNLGQSLSGVEANYGRQRAGTINQTGSAVAGAVGGYQGEKNWNSFLDKSYRSKNNSGRNSSWDDGNDYDDNDAW